MQVVPSDVPALPTRQGLFPHGSSSSMMGPSSTLLPDEVEESDIRKKPLDRTTSWIVRGAMLHEDGKPKSVRRVRMGWRDWLQGTREGQLFFMVMVGIILIGLGAATWSQLGPNGDFNTSFWHSGCISYFFFIDPGTQTGISPTDPARVLWTGIFFSFLGFLFNLTLFGVLVEIVRKTLDRWMKERSRIVMNGHTLVLGWTDKTLFLLRERLDAAENLGLRRQDIIVLADRDEAEMINDVRDFLPEKSQRHVIKVRRGFPWNPNDLMRTSVCSALEVIVLGQSSSAHESDLEIMRIMVALGSLHDTFSGRLIAEIRCTETRPKVEALLPNAGGIVARNAINHILCRMAIRLSLGTCLASLCSFESHSEFYAVQVSTLCGHAFGETLERFTSSICIGVKPPDARVLIAPPDDYVIGPRDTLIVLAADISKIHERDREAESIKVMGNPRDLNDMAWRVSSLVTPRITGIQPQVAVSKSIEISSLKDGDGDSVFIVAGWPDDCGDFMQLLDRYVPPKTTVHILADRSLEARATLLGNRPPLKNINLSHHVGDRTSVGGLVELPLWEARAIVVVSESEDLHGQHLAANMSDAENLACVLTISSICEGKYQKEHMRPLSGNLICEVLDARTDRLISRNHRLSSMCSFFRSNALETGLFATAASHPLIFNVLTLLMIPNTVEDLALIPITEYLIECPPQEDDAVKTKADGGYVGELIKLSFRELQKRVASSVNTSGILIGWCHQGEPPILAPDADRFQLRPWAASDQLLVVHRTAI